MRTPCELIVIRFFPTLRARVAYGLRHDHGVRPSDIAVMIGTSNAAVSQYTSGVRGGDEEVIKEFPEVEAFAAMAAATLAEKHAAGEQFELSYMLGRFCMQLQRNPLFKEMVGAGEMSECGICTNRE